MMGVMSIVWPITMPVGVKRRSRLPSGPDLDRSRKTKRPTVTVGRLKRVWIAFIKPLLPRNCRDSIIPPRGMQIRDAKKAELKEMDRDRTVIPITSGLRVTMSSIALRNPAAISSNGFHLNSFMR